MHSSGGKIIDGHFWFSPCVSKLKKGHKEQERLRAHHITQNSVSQLNSIVLFNIKSELNLLSRNSNLYNVEILKPYHNNLTFWNQYIIFLKHKLCIAQTMSKRAVLSLFMRFNRFQRHAAECSINSGNENTFLCTSCLCGISAECTFDTTCCFSGWLNVKYHHNLLAEYKHMEYGNYMILQQLHGHSEKTRQSIQDSGFHFGIQCKRFQEIWTFNEIILKHSCKQLYQD